MDTNNIVFRTYAIVPIPWPIEDHGLSSTQIACEFCRRALERAIPPGLEKTRGHRPRLQPEGRACATIPAMYGVLLAILLQSASVSGSITMPPGTTPPATARAALLPFEYANVFNAQAQIRLDNYWEDFKASGMAKRNKELFIQFMPVAYNSALEVALTQMRRDTRINSANLIRTASQGQFEFRSVPPGEYKLIVTANLKGTEYVWMETLQVQSAPLVVQIKNHVP